MAKDEEGLRAALLEAPERLAFMGATRGDMLVVPHKDLPRSRWMRRQLRKLRERSSKGGNWGQYPAPLARGSQGRLRAPKTRRAVLRRGLRPGLNHASWRRLGGRHSGK